MDAALERLRAGLADRYRVDRELGSGGMAVVYLAHDLKTPRPVAIKVMRAELATAIGVERFLREIEIAASFNHPHILHLYDSGQADGLPYYVMPYVEGETLRTKLQRERQLPIEDAIRIACEVAEALSYAHSRGVVHRDIKPENIIFSSGKAVVADFGIARAAVAASLDTLTGTGISIGTPAYMSPEQAVGDQQIDGRSDLYSLGCVLYEMLAGSTPFSGSTSQAVLARHISESPPPIRIQRRAVPESLERVLAKALEKSPADRFSLAAQFAEALVSRGSAASDDLGESIAVLPFANLPRDSDTEYLSDGIAEEIINVLARIPGLRVAARTSSFAFRDKTPDLDVAEIGAKLKVATVLEGSVKKAGNRLRVNAQLIKVADGHVLWSESYDSETTDVFAIQDHIAKGIAARFQVSLGRDAEPPTKNLDAYHLYLKGRYHWQQRGPGLETALKCFSQTLALDPNYALAHAGLADACTIIAQYGMAPQDVMLPKARAAVQRALDLAPELAEAHCAAGTLKLVFDWNWTGAARDLRRAIELNPRYGAARTWLALYLSLVESRFDEALTHARRAVELDPTPLALAQLGMVLIAADRHQDALEPLQQAAEIGPLMLLPHLYLGVTYNHLGETEKAIAFLDTAAKNSGRHQLALAELAVCYHAIGRQNDVEAIHDELVARARREYMMSSMLALVTACVGRVDEAFRLLDRACQERDGILIYSRRYPAFKLLQQDPRILEIYRRIGFPP